MSRTKSEYKSICLLVCQHAHALNHSVIIWCRYLDMATAISGSGPAYYYMVMEAMVDSAVHMGFSRDVARTLVLQTMKVCTAHASHLINILER